MVCSGSLLSDGQPSSFQKRVNACLSTFPAESEHACTCILPDQFLCFGLRGFAMAMPKMLMVLVQMILVMTDNDNRRKTRMMMMMLMMTTPKKLPEG